MFSRAVIEPPDIFSVLGLSLRLGNEVLQCLPTRVGPDHEQAGSITEREIGVSVL